MSLASEVNGLTYTVELLHTEPSLRRGQRPAGRYTMDERSIWWLLFASSITGIIAGIVSFSRLLFVALILLALLITRHRRRIYVAILMLPRDIR